jgi:hypothetical protein
VPGHAPVISMVIEEMAAVVAAKFHASTTSTTEADNLPLLGAVDEHLWRMGVLA